MVFFSKLGQLGRLGNQLFQYAALRGLSIKNSYNISIPSNVSNFHGQEYLLKNFSIPEKFFSKKSFIKTFFLKKYTEKSTIEIDKNFFDIPDSTDLQGYFQSMFYFYHCIDIIKKELKPKFFFIDNAEKKLKKIKNKNKGYKIVSLHMRRGDIVDKSISYKINNDGLLNLYGFNKFDKKSFYGNYLEKSKNKFKGQKVKFLIFSGGSQLEDKNVTDLDWCKKNFKGDEYLFIEPQESFADFCMIMLCDHNIISPVSSFGWWAAFLKQKKGGITIAPHIYDPTLPNIAHRHMFYPKNWILV